MVSPVAYFAYQGLSRSESAQSVYLFASLLCIVAALRFWQLRVYLDDDRLTIVNMTWIHHLPWSAVERFELHHGGARVRRLGGRTHRISAFARPSTDPFGWGANNVRAISTLEAVRQSRQPWQDQPTAGAS